MIEAGAAFLAWVGAALVVLSDGRRGLAVGLAIATFGLGAIVLLHAGPLEAALVALGGAAGAARRWTSGVPGWGTMPAGSTPRFVLCVATALVGVWFALIVTTGAGADVKFAALVAVALSGARVLSSADPDVLLTAVGLLALAAAAAAGPAETASGAWPYALAALIAAGACWVRPGSLDAA